MLAVRLPRVSLTRWRDVAQRSIEILIGRLTTDEAFRSAFRGNATMALTGFIESGYDLTPLEIAAVRMTPPDVWERIAEQIDPRLQKVSYTTASTDREEL